MRTRQSPYEIVADGSDEGGTSHCIVLFCKKYRLSGISGRGCERRVASRLVAGTERAVFQASKSVGYRRGIPPAVHVCYKLFWNWNGVVRFVSRDKRFVIWHLQNYCLVQIVSLWSLSIAVPIISTTNELVSRIRNFKSNAFKNKNYAKNAPQARFFYEIKCATGKIYETKCARGQIFWLSPNGYSVLLI
jgi:hypothetical protein